MVLLAYQSNCANTLTGPQSSLAGPPGWFVSSHRLKAVSDFVSKMPGFRLSAAVNGTARLGEPGGPWSQPGATGVRSALHFHHRDGKYAGLGVPQEAII